MTGAVQSGELLRRLREGIAYRQIGEGMRCLEAHRAFFESLTPAQPNAGSLVGYLAQWVDIGFDGPQIITRLLPRFPKEVRASLPLVDYLHLRMAEGLVAMGGEEFDQAIAHFQFVESVEEEVRDPEMLAISNFWIGRCLRNQGRYDDALEFTRRARKLAQGLGNDKMAAVMQVMESWLYFQKGKLQDAARLLQQAEMALRTTDDFITRGNIQSARGRIARREGRFERALQYFNNSIAEYQQRNPRHPHVARSLVNMASAERLICVQLRKKLDAAVARRKNAGNRVAAPSGSTAQERSGLADLREQALAQLEEAWSIYESQDNHRGMGAVHIHRGFLCLDSGELDRAGSEAASAFRLGEQKTDYILMARSRILQCMVENAKFEEQIGEAGETNRHAQLAHDSAREAVEYAKHTQNPRLLARAYIWQGITYANDFFENPDAARQCCDAAAALLKPQGADYLWDDLQELRGRILRRGPIDPVLREWSEGLVGNKSFQQITEEFAHIIIPKVWEREQRKVSRVAEKLSISPKKVRRVLRAAGLMNGKDQRTGR
jgi:tetratricopeptide (TPR) repeat protein